MSTKLSYGSDIPGARQDVLNVANEMLEIAIQLERAGLRKIAERVSKQEQKLRDTVQAKMTRKYNGRCAPTRSGLPTVEQVRRVLVYLKDDTLQQQDIGKKVGINAGRVSEILNGLIYIEGDEVKRRTRVDSNEAGA